MSSLLAQAEQAMKDKKLDEAFALFSKIIAQDESQPDMWHDRAICSFHMGNMQAAMADLNKAAELQPDYGYRYSSRAYIRAAMKDIHGAIADYKKALELDPDDAITHNNLGLLEEQLGYTKDAQDRFKVADELQEMLSENQIGSNGEALPVPEPVNIQKEIEQEKQEPTGLVAEIKKAIFTKEGRKEFGEFLKGKKPE